jgi:methionine-rich copper-binding protein CopC
MKMAATHGFRTHARFAVVTAITISALAISSWSIPSAWGHNVVLETSPEAGSTISDSPVDIRIVTNDKLLDLGGTGSGFAIVVKDVNGLHYGDGCVTVGEADMTATVALGAAGDYTVTFQFVSADGHSLSDSFGFSFAPGSSHSPARGFFDPPVCGVESGLVDAPVGDITEAPPSEESSFEPILEQGAVEEQSERWPITLAIAGVLVVLSLTLLVWMVRRRNGS